MENILSYDYYLVQFSGGKDSTAAFLYLLDKGIPREKIELWHQDIDGREEAFYDWPITTDYCRKLAETFGVTIRFQWKMGGFKREMLRNNSRTAPTRFELPDGSTATVGGKRGKLSTRMKFPQCSPDLKVRWCSGYLKVDVASAAIRNNSRFIGKRVLVISGERGEESPQRAKYAKFEIDRTDCRNGKAKRWVDRYRPVLDWKEAQVWSIIEHYHIRVHPCYYMGWSRCSCMWCIFGNKHQFASAACINPERANELIIFESKFGYTIKRNTDLQTLISSGIPYQHISENLSRLAASYIYNKPIIIPQDEPWILPAGAYGENCGPN